MSGGRSGAEMPSRAHPGWIMLGRDASELRCGHEDGRPGRCGERHTERWALVLAWTHPIRIGSSRKRATVSSSFRRWVHQSRAHFQPDLRFAKSTSHAGTIAAFRRGPGKIRGVPRGSETPMRARGSPTGHPGTPTLPSHGSSRRAGAAVAAGGGKEASGGRPCLRGAAPAALAPACRHARRDRRYRFRNARTCRAGDASSGPNGGVGRVPEDAGERRKIRRGATTLHQSSGPLPLKASTKWSMKARSFGCMNRPGG